MEGLISATDLCKEAKILFIQVDANHSHYTLTPLPLLPRNTLSRCYQIKYLDIF